MKIFGSLGLDLGSQPKAMARLMRELDQNGSGQVSLSEMVNWWRRSGKQIQEKLTSLNDLMSQAHDMFDNIDVDGSGSIERAEVERLVNMLGVQASDAEIDHAWRQMDKGGSGKVNFVEFWSWWTDRKSNDIVEQSKQQVEAVKKVFDHLDDDCSGTLQTAGLLQLAQSLGVVLTPRDLESVLDAIDPHDREAVQFLEFYRWWNSNSADMLAAAKRQQATTIGTAAILLDSSVQEQQLLKAAEQGDVSELKRLLNDGADPNCNVMGQFPLTIAAANGHLDFVEELLEQHNNMGVGVRGIENDVPLGASECNLLQCRRLQ